MNEQPLMRYGEAMPTEQDGRPMIVLNDPFQISEGLAVSIPAFFLVTLMDGERNAAQMSEEFEKQFGQTISVDDVREFIAQMDKAFWLDNETFHTQKKRLRDEFLSLPTRPAVLAGVSYPDDPKLLGEILDELLFSRPKRGGDPVKGVVVPHIDFRVGADMMADGWREAIDADAELYLILGTGHSLSGDFFACIDKDFETPVGVVPTDAEFLAALAKNFGEDLYSEADMHKNEHSIEFQTLFLAHLLKSKPNAKAAPILLSFPEQIWEIDHPVFSGPRLDRFVEALKKTVKESGRKTVIVASVDLSHVGARFGDQIELDDETLDKIEVDDRAIIDDICRLDADAFLKDIVRVAPTNRICGFPPLHVMMKICDAQTAELIAYRQNIEGERETMVSFATLVLR